MKEIEYKFKTNNISFEQLIEIFNKKTKLDKTQIKIQEDKVFLLKEQIGKPIVAGSKIARIRALKVKDEIKHILTLKIQTEVKLVSDEYEFEINNLEAAESFLKALDFVQNVEVSKKRLEFKTDNYNVCIDQVEKLGVFIELEVLTKDSIDQNDIKLIQQQMKQYLKDLKIKGELCSTPYDTQIENLRNQQKA